jgi:hypothetical protein
MHNLIIGLFFGWVLFTVNGRESFWNAYHVIDQMGEHVTAGMVKDMDIKPQATEPEPETDERREAYIEMCSRYGFTKPQCRKLWDQDSQTALTEDEKPVKIKQHKPTEPL